MISPWKIAYAEFTNLQQRAPSPKFSCLAFLVATIGFVSPISAQQPAFAAASVKPSRVAGAMTGVKGDPGNYHAGNVTLHDLYRENHGCDDRLPPRAPEPPPAGKK
jgi:hypothetical protein